MTLNLPIEDNGFDKYEFKFVVNDNNWQINSNLPQVKDKNGNVNNYVSLPGSRNSNSAPQQAQITVISNPNEYTFPDMRYARRVLNEIHEECTKHNADIFLHQ